MIPAPSLRFLGSHGKTMLSASPSSLLLTSYVSGASCPGPALLSAEELPPQELGEHCDTRFTATLTPVLV